MTSIDPRKPLVGERLNAVLSWQRNTSGAGCYCDASSRNQKWGLVMETIHYALYKRTGAGYGDLMKETLADMVRNIRCLAMGPWARSL